VRTAQRCYLYQKSKYEYSKVKSVLQNWSTDAGRAKFARILYDHVENRVMLQITIGAEGNVTSLLPGGSAGNSVIPYNIAYKFP